jgi:heterotetrameric sarcosine oxidase gamma subunit
MNAPLSCRLERRPAGPLLEFVAFGFPLGGAFVVGWPAAPGAVRHEADGRPALLHFAPARWLAPAAEADVIALIAAAIEAGAGIVVDVEGKWQAFELHGDGAGRVLASTLDVAAVLETRECAAVTLFDCPAVITRLPGGYAIWVRASYAQHFEASIARLARG